MKLAVVGSRDFSDYELLKKEILDYVDVRNLDAIVSGGARGADRLGEQFAEEYGLPIIIFKPDWQQFGRAAGHIRNKDIISAADIVIAFWDGKSKGTKGSIDLSDKLNKKLKIVKFGVYT